MNIKEMQRRQEFVNGLKVGDRVAIEKYIRYGWGYDEAARYEYETVSRITPKRTKIDFESGDSVEKDSLKRICPITEETDRANKIFNCRDELFKKIHTLNHGEKGKTKTLEAREIKESNLERAIEIIDELIGMLKIESCE